MTMEEHENGYAYKFYANIIQALDTQCIDIEIKLYSSLRDNVG